jgi:hypothetical protein
MLNRYGLSRKRTLERIVLYIVQGKIMSLRCENGTEKFNESVHASGKGEDKE